MPGRVRRLCVFAGNTWRSNRLLVYAAVIGVFGGLGAQLFVRIVDWGERIFSVCLAGLNPVATTLGGLLCGLIVYTLAPEAEGHETEAAVAAYHLDRGKVGPSCRRSRQLPRPSPSGRGVHDA